MPNILELDTPQASDFDAAQWRPVNDKTATEALASITLTAGNPDVVGATVDSPRGWTARLCFHAEIKPRPFAGEASFGPYLILMWEEESARGVWLIRQDVDLAIS